MDIYKLFPRTTLTVDSLEPGKAYRSVVDRVEVRDGPAGQRAVLILSGTVNGYKEVYLNRTSAYRLATAFGPETDRWAGKGIIITRKRFYGREGVLVIPDNTQAKGGER